MVDAPHWIVEIWNYKEYRSCSACSKCVDYMYGYQYCPWCGTKLDGREEVIQHEWEGTGLDVH